MLFYHEKIIAYVRLRSGRARRLRRTREDRVRQTAEIVAGVVKDTEMDREASWDKYTVYFNSGSRVSFEGGKGDWSEIVMKNGAVPATVIPVRIKTYVADNYSQSMVNRLSTMKEGYKVGLTNGLTLYFDKEGKFKKLDR